MPEGTSRLRAINAYLAALKRLGVPTRSAYLFGSHATGEAKPESDIDLIIVSPIFSCMPQWKRWEILGDALSEIREPIDVLAYSPEEFDAGRNRKASFLGHVLKRARALTVTQPPVS